MSIEMMTAVWKQSRHKGGKLILLLAIADYANDQGVAWPSIESLAEKTRMSERNVHYTLKELIDEADPELSVDANAGPYRTNLYRLNLQGAKSSGCKTTQKRVQNPAKRVQPIAPNPSLEPSIEPSYIAADAAPPQKPANPSKKKATSRQTPIQPEAVMVPPAPPVAPEQAAADLAAWDALEAAPPEARHGRAPSFQNDHWGWYEGLIYVTTGWTRREFEQKKSETVQKAYHAHAKKHHGLGRHVKTLLENFAPGGWRWQTHAYKTSKPNLGEIDQLWGDWEQTPVLNFPPPSAPRAAYVPPPIPEDVVKLDQNRRRELRRLGLLQAGGLNGSLISHEKHAG